VPQSRWSPQWPVSKGQGREVPDWLVFAGFRSVVTSMAGFAAARRLQRSADRRATLVFAEPIVSEIRLTTSSRNLFISTRGNLTNNNGIRFGPLMLCLVPVMSVALAGCGWRGKSSTKSTIDSSKANRSLSRNSSDPCAVVLAPQTGKDRVDQEIARWQEEARRMADSRAIEQLGWMFVSKARLSYDPGYYRLAEQSARCIESSHPGSPEALLLRGHALHNLHHFREAEAVARELVARREMFLDYGLLGDALVEQGRLTEAAHAYQKMVDLRPGPESYSRAAYLRWLKGDLAGALELMRVVTRAASPRDPDSAAWAYSRLALYELQAGETKKALEACGAALDFQLDYAPALLARGRILLAKGQDEEAIAALQLAATSNPLPDYQWTLADALRVVGRVEQARSVEAQMIGQGAASDPRTLALYLATRNEQIETALQLAERELQTRGDVFTLDAIAWSLRAAGRAEEAHARMKQALAEGTEDARLFFHAGVIAAELGQNGEAQQWLKKAAGIRQMLLPSEQEQLSRHLAAL